MSGVRAAVQTTSEAFELRTVQLPALGAADVLLDVVACGICGSNLHGWFNPGSAIGDIRAPGAVGHEIAGIVRSTGSAVSGVAPGDRVCVEPNEARACGECDACSAGRAWFCSKPSALPVFGFAEAMLVPARSVRILPANVPTEVGALVEPFACSVHGLRTSTSKAHRGGTLDGASVAVIGAGTLGLGAIAAARFLGASNVIAVGRHEAQRVACDRLGADEVMTELEGEKHLRHRAPDVVIEAVGGSAATLALAARSVRPGGEVVVLGLFDCPQMIDVRLAMFREIRMSFPVTYGVVDGIHDFTLALDLLASDPRRFRPLITHELPLDEIENAFATAADKSRGAMKVLVKP